jgi:hypothetical protein
MRAPWLLLVAALTVSLGASLFWGVQESRELTRARLGAVADQTTRDDIEGQLRTAERARNAAET